MNIRLQYLAKMNKNGVADNVHLDIDTDKRVYNYFVNPWVGGTDYIDCVRKSDITDLVVRLEHNGFRQMKV